MFQPFYKAYYLIKIKARFRCQYYVFERFFTLFLSRDDLVFLFIFLDLNPAFLICRYLPRGYRIHLGPIQFTNSMNISTYKITC